MSQLPETPADRPALGRDDEPASAPAALEAGDIDFDAVLGEALAAVEKHTRKPEEHGEAAEPVDHSEVVHLRQALEDAHRESARLKAEFARAQEDLGSLRRLTQRQEADLPQQAVRRILVELLPAMDHLDTLCQYMLAKPDLASADRQALEMLDMEWRRAQQRLQLEPYDAVGQSFDGQRHEVIATLSDAAHPAGVVLRQAGRGYLWNSKLLRLAQVVINGHRSGASH
jgi:molecular chaperone GrpE (heat shock protein)